MAISAARARAIAAGYADGPCPAITAFSHGAQVSYESFMAQLDMLSAECGFEAHEDVRTLADWAGQTTDLVWR